ncbi:GNAT family N-acetyltransferase [Lapidilactobacillus bayanensis]|uniref:GNAT family N-acetyltransferase n=1 Tax=Lapidilactobacillus bayanensis TaxID=2485998 RepID=UPI000F768859|nr:N-acetyltransferase [Lapidilactobacillus bayanensis]
MALLPIKHLTREQWSHYVSHRADDSAWGIYQQAQLIAVVETIPDGATNTLQIVAFEVTTDDSGQALIDLVLEQAALENRQRIILIDPVNRDLFLKNNFQAIGANLVWQRPQPLKLTTLKIRQETEKDFAEVESMINQAFWNKFQPGSQDAYLVHELRQSPIYLPELSRIAVVNGEIVGGIFYSKAIIQQVDREVPILTFGPLGVAPHWQGSGIGTKLLKETLVLATQANYRGIVMTGVPSFYLRQGFQTTDHFGITLADGTTPNFLMGYELQPQGLSSIPGVYAENDFFESLSIEQADYFNERFTKRPQQWFPQQL